MSRVPRVRFGAAGAALLSVVGVVGVGSPLAAQTPVRVRYTFDGQSRARAGEADGVSRVLATRQASRAWQDSVEVLLDQEMEERGEPLGLARAHDGERADYRVSVVALPVLGGDRRPTGLTTYALTLFEPGVTVAWKFVTNSVAYSGSAAAAAAEIATFATRAITEKASR